MKKFVSTYDQILLEGEARGEARGETRGEARGRATLLLQQLERRFGALPEAIITRVTTASIAELDAWALRVLDVPSLSDVFAAK